jgi:Ferritin-like
MAKHHTGLFARIEANTTDRTALQEAAQLAIQIEFTTIPAYLTALYSISDVSSEPYQALRSVVMEEMFHLNQAANLLVGIGGLPSFTGAAVPTYPGYLPNANPNSTPWIGLSRASTSLFSDVFCAIERPAAPHAPAQGNQYDTIAQVYEALQDGLASFPDQKALFTPAPSGVQRLDIYPGKFGGQPVQVVDLDSANSGIDQILRQGEGSVPPDQNLVPVEPYGAYNHYGNRTDGTYGPILGTPLELSHFAKFRKIALSSVFPDTYPILSNPTRSQYPTGSLALQLAVLFDVGYSVMLESMEASFTTATTPYDLFYAVTLPAMHAFLPTVARLLMTTPIDPNGDSSIGPNAAPTWLYVPKSGRPSVSSLVAQLPTGLISDAPRAALMAAAAQLDQQF